MIGFFSRKEIESKSRPDGKIPSCTSCQLYKNAKNARMKPCGNFKKGIMIIGEAPGEVEDENGKPWQGRTGHLLQRTLRKLGIDLFEDCISLNAVNCRPMEKGENRTPTNHEIECCKTRVSTAIEEYMPKMILILGGAALYSVVGNRWKRDLGGISKWRGFCIPDQDLKTWICPTFHPSFIERGEEEVSTIWIQDLAQAVNKAGQPFPTSPPTTIKEIDDLKFLEAIIKEPTSIAIDFETTGKKPHAEGHRIICMAIATSPQYAYVFMIPNTKQGRQPLLNILANPNIKKYAQNMKFEATWSEVRLRQEIEGWEWDTMQAAHILDNRSGVTGLKFQTYVNFGIVDYSSEIDPYLTSSRENNSNSINNINKLISSKQGRTRLMEYCALDAIYTYRLATIQMDLINDDLPF